MYISICKLTIIIKNQVPQGHTAWGCELDLYLYLSLPISFPSFIIYIIFINIFVSVWFSTKIRGSGVTTKIQTEIAQNNKFVKFKPVNKGWKSLICH